MELPDAQFHQLMDCPGPGAYLLGGLGVALQKNATYVCVG